MHALGTNVHQGVGGVALTKSDSASQGTFRGIYVGGAGDVTLKGLDGNNVTFSAVPVGTVLWVGFTHLMSTGTGATLCTGIT
jgi:hypothetical protein